MTDIAVKYMGLELRSPVILASGPLSSSLKGLYEAENAGVGAVVLKSLFEEQIEKDSSAKNIDDEFLAHADGHQYYERMQEDWYIDRYMDLVEKAKKALHIPVIASINCRRLSTWIEYADRFETCGADAIELNYFPLAADPDNEGSETEEELIKLAKKARKKISVPISIKLGYRYTSLPHVVRELEKAGIDAVVFFNRLWRPDIDLEKLTFKPSQDILSDSNDYHESLRWTALISPETKMDIAANGGIHSADTLIKMILAGATAAEVLSAPMKEGWESIEKMNAGLRAFMEKHGFTKLSDFCGMLSQENREDGDAWERVQFLKTIEN